MKRLTILFLLFANFAFSQNDDSQKQLNELVNGILKSVLKEKPSKRVTSYYKEVINVTDIVNSSTKARFSGGKTRTGFKLNFPVGTTSWFYRITVMEPETSFYYTNDYSLSSLLKTQNSLFTNNQTNYGIDFFVIDDFSIDDFLQTGNNDFKCYTDYTRLNSIGFVNYSKLVKDNLWIGIRNPNLTQGLKVIIEAVAFGDFN